MECEETRDLLSSYLDKELSQASAQSVECHLRDCAECRDCLAGLEQVAESLREMPREQLSELGAKRLEKAVGREIKQRQKAAEPTVPLLRRLMMNPAVGYSVASVAVLALAVVVWVGPRATTKSQMMMKPGVEENYGAPQEGEAPAASAEKKVDN